MKKLNLVIAAMALIFIFGCAQQTAQQNVPAAQPPSQPAAQVGAAGAAITINIENYAFSPASVTVKQGTTVTWVQKDSAPHTLTSDDGLFDSGTLSTGQTWSYTFNQAGTFAYHCSIHPLMKAAVIVE